TNEPVCQIGQPVALRAGTVLRIAIGARALAQAFKEDASCGQVIADIRMVLGRIERRLRTM
ncbi:MAG: hypothetical protein KGO02_21185, partial [Alphaproteobacteria bacterium]|nr:hypothetical protein [Alphaproteobacteria bacterium]